MKKLFFMLILLFLIYFGIQYVFEAFSKGETKDYKIEEGNTTIQIHEISTLNRKNENDNYYWTLNAGNQDLSFQLFQEFKRKSEVITSIKYFKNSELECFLPIFTGNEILTDVMCTNGSLIHYYHDIKGKSSELDQFAQSLKEFGYDEKDWMDQKQNPSKDTQASPLTAYLDNLVEDHYVGVTDYRGISLMGKFVSILKIRKTELFNNDVYDRPISTMFGKFYLTADYNVQYNFTRFFIVDMTSGKQSEILYHSKISFDSYIQGSVGSSIYLFDNDSKKQYEIDLKHKKIVECGNESTGIKFYDNGTWSNKNTSEAVHKNLIFPTLVSDYQDPSYAHIDRIGKERGYYYLYRKVGNKYEAYHADIQNKSVLTYLFTTTRIDNIVYLDDYVYYQDGNDVKYFEPKHGNRTVFNNTELSFNANIFFGVYKK